MAEVDKNTEFDNNPERRLTVESSQWEIGRVTLICNSYDVTRDMLSKLYNTTADYDPEVAAGIMDGELSFESRFYIGPNEYVDEHQSAAHAIQIPNSEKYLLQFCEKPVSLQSNAPTGDINAWAADFFKEELESDDAVLFSPDALVFVTGGDKAIEEFLTVNEINSSQVDVSVKREFYAALYSDWIAASINQVDENISEADDLIDWELTPELARIIVVKRYEHFFQTMYGGMVDLLEPQHLSEELKQLAEKVKLVDFSELDKADFTELYFGILRTFNMLAESSVEPAYLPKLFQLIDSAISWENDFNPTRERTVNIMSAEYKVSETREYDVTLSVGYYVYSHSHLTEEGYQGISLDLEKRAMFINFVPKMKSVSPVDLEYAVNEWFPEVGRIRNNRKTVPFTPAAVTRKLIEGNLALMANLNLDLTEEMFNSLPLDLQRSLSEQGYLEIDMSGSQNVAGENGDDPNQLGDGYDGPGEIGDGDWDDDFPN